MEELTYLWPNIDPQQELVHYIDNNGEAFSYFGPVSKVNILVGATNSGKSRFMRGLARSNWINGFSLAPDVDNPSVINNICSWLSKKDFEIILV